MSILIHFHDMKQATAHVDRVGDDWFSAITLISDKQDIFTLFSKKNCATKAEAIQEAFKMVTDMSDAVLKVQMEESVKDKQE